MSMKGLRMCQQARDVAWPGKSAAN